MPNQMQAFVLGTDGNLWLETGPWGNIPRVIQHRLQVDGYVNQAYAQVGGNRIWRPAFQPLSSDEIFVLGSDGNLWHETGSFRDIAQTIADRRQVDGSVAQFWAVDSQTVFVLGTDGILWYETNETGQWGNVAETMRTRVPVDGSVFAFQVLDAQTLFVLGDDGNLWFETGPWKGVFNTINTRQQVDGSVAQFWAVDQGTVFVTGSDLNLWFEQASTPGSWDVSNTIEFRTPIDANVNDIQPLDENTVFVQGHDGNLWLETGPFVSVAQTIATRQWVLSYVGAWEALSSSELYVIDGNQNLSYVSYDGDATLQPVDGYVNACYPLYSPPQL